MDPTFVVMGVGWLIWFVWYEVELWFRKKKCVVVKNEVKCKGCYWLKVEVCEGMVWYERMFGVEWKCGDLWLGQYGVLGLWCESERGGVRDSRSSLQKQRDNQK